jgi:hypothetical protein
LHVIFPAASFLSSSWQRDKLSSRSVAMLLQSSGMLQLLVLTSRTLCSTTSLSQSFLTASQASAFSQGSRCLSFASLPSNSRGTAARGAGAGYTGGDSGGDSGGGWWWWRRRGAGRYAGAVCYPGLSLPVSDKRGGPRTRGPPVSLAVLPAGPSRACSIGPNY